MKCYDLNGSNISQCEQHSALNPNEVRLVR